MARLVISNLGTLSSGGGKEGSTGDPHSQTLKEFGDGTTGEGGGVEAGRERQRKKVGTKLKRQLPTTPNHMKQQFLLLLLLLLLR